MAKPLRPDSQTAEVMDAPYDPAKGLFGLALDRMRETSSLRKQKGKAFDLCLPWKPNPRPNQGPRNGFAAAAVRGKPWGNRPHRQTSGHQVNQQPQQQQPWQTEEPWGKHLFAAAAAKPTAKDQRWQEETGTLTAPTSSLLLPKRKKGSWEVIENPGVLFQRL